MSRTGRLVIYDSTDRMSEHIAHRRNADSRIPADSGESLREQLDLLVDRRMRFNRVVFDTHGNAGLIAFGNFRLDVHSMRGLFTGRGYDQLFPCYSRMYFSGCKISRGENGWLFLEEANRIFFNRGGGVNFAYTSMGYSWKWFPNPKHFTGELRITVNKPGGSIRRFTGSDLIHGRLDSGAFKNACILYWVEDLQ